MVLLTSEEVFATNGRSWRQDINLVRKSRATSNIALPVSVGEGLYRSSRALRTPEFLVKAVIETSVVLPLRLSSTCLCFVWLAVKVLWDLACVRVARISLGVNSQGHRISIE